ncbi:autophagy protein Apg5-domain-containing protein [Geopyxis carbonaria]|nr:autophagy protein Apg5-domain-containing protein [Geopyxis carbonaria]
MEFESLRQAVWNGTIPCRIELDLTECRVLESSEPFYLSIPRISYLPLFIPQIYRFFEPNIKSQSANPDTAWFEFENVPLKWHWPVGVLYDLFTGRDPSAAPENDESSLPWNLTLHLQNYPVKHVMRLDKPSACHEAWVNSIKEADHVRNGNSKCFMSLSKTESTCLWESLISHSFDNFWSINEKLLMSSYRSIRSIPLRLYIPSAPRVIQEPISPFQVNQDKKKVQLLGTVLHQILPELFPTKRFPVFARPVIHGAVVAMNTPVIELMYATVYTDGFLHITLAMIS